jgi:4'-phosphopantetheinyl transferase
MPGHDEIHVWVISWRRAAHAPCLLTDVEHEVAGSIVSRGARARYVASRTLLRRHLSRILGEDPLAVRIVEGPDGKPDLAEPVLSFNLSHAGDLIALAISRPRRLGVDVERIRPDLDVCAVTEELFDSADRDAIGRATEREGARAFFRYWTRYEALVKARGDGSWCRYEEWPRLPPASTCASST